MKDYLFPSPAERENIYAMRTSITVSSESAELICRDFEHLKQAAGIEFNLTFALRIKN